MSEQNVIDFRSEFVNRFGSKISAKYSSEELRYLMNELTVFISDYEIQKRCTDLVVYTNPIPECYESFLVEKKISNRSDGTLKQYDFKLKDFFCNIDKPIDQLQKEDIIKYLYQLRKRKKVSDRSVEGYRIVINQFLNWALNNGYIAKNPAQTIGAIKFSSEPRKPLSPEEIYKMRQGCMTLRQKAIFEFFLGTGMRVSEVVELTIDRIDFNTRIIQTHGKGDKWRKTFLTPAAKEALISYLNSRSDNCPYVFVTSKGEVKGLIKEAIRKEVHIIAKNAGINRSVFPHLIRHTFATESINRGMPATSLQIILGHSRLDTTMIYAKTNPEVVQYDHKKYAG